MRPSKTGTAHDGQRFEVVTFDRLPTLFPFREKSSRNRGYVCRPNPFWDVYPVRLVAVRPECYTALPVLEIDDRFTKYLAQDGDKSVPAMGERRDGNLANLAAVIRVTSQTVEGAAT